MARGALVLAVAAATLLVPNLARADTFPFEVTWSGQPSTNEGAAVGYTVTLRNTGGDAREVFLQDAPGERVTVASIVPSQGTCENYLTWRRCALGVVPAGGTATASYTSTVSGVGRLLVPFTAMPTATGGDSTFASYPVQVFAAGEPLLTDVRLSITAPASPHPLWMLGRYTIKATNVDSVTARGVALEGLSSHDDRLVRPSSASGPCHRVFGWSPTLVRCSIGDLAPGASAEMHVEVFGDGGAGHSQLIATLEQDRSGTPFRRERELEKIVMYGTRPPVPPGPTGGPGSDLELTVSRPEEPVPAGTPFTWTDTITNRGSAPSGPIRLTAGAHSVSDMIEPTNAECTQTVVITYCDLPSLAPGESTSHTFTGYPFEATGAVAEHSELVQSNGSTASVLWRNVAYNPGADQADMAIEPLSQGTAWTPDHGLVSVTRWKVTNHGPGFLLNGTLRLRFEPSSAAYLPAWSDCTDCPLGMLPMRAGDSYEFGLRTTGSTAPARHHVRVLGTAPDPVPANNSGSMDVAPILAPGPGPGGGGGGGAAMADLAVTAAATRTTFAPNEQVEIVVRVANSGVGADASGLRAQIVLPPDVRLLGPPAVERGTGCTGTSTLDCNLDYLPRNAATPIRFWIDVGAAGSKSIVVRVSSAGGDRAPADNSTVVPFIVVAPVLPPAAPAPSGVKGVTRTGTNGPNVLVGTARADVLNGRGGNDRLVGAAGDDRLIGGPGNDRVLAGLGRDVVDGGAGADTILIRDGERDTVRCGSGRDTVTADRVDKVARDCEVVRRR